MRDVLAIGLVAILAAIGGFLLGTSGSRPRAESALTIAGRSSGPAGVLPGTQPSTAGHPVYPVRRPLPFRPKNSAEERERFTRDLRSIGKDSNPIDRLATLAQLLENLSPETLPRVLEAFEKIPPTSEYLNEYRMLLYAWTTFDRAGAIEFVEDTVAGGMGGELGLSQEDLLKPVLASWASQDPKPALDWYNELPEEQQTHHLKMSLMSGWATNNPYEATEYLQTQPANQNREYLIGQLANQMFRQDPRGAAGWAESIEDVKLKEQAFEELAEDWVSVDPEGLAGWLRDHVSERYAWEAIEDLGRGWVASDSDAATAWFESLPDGAAKQRGIHKMVESWADNDLLAMGEWLNSLPDSKITDLGVQAYAKRLVDQAPEAALDSAMSISDDDMRSETVQELAQEFYSLNQEAALAWANNTSYPPEALERTWEAYAKLNARQLQLIDKEINRDQVLPDRMRELRQTQSLLQEQAAQIKQAVSR